MFFKYQKKDIFSIPIATTPAADPIINILPPVPAAKAIKCHSGASVAIFGNIPILAATKGTLSTIADAPPRINIKGFIPIPSTTLFPKSKINPNDSRAATVIKIPKKNNKLGISILPSAL